MPDPMIGKTVIATHNPDYDREYVKEVRLARKATDGQTGKVIKSHDGHGLCYDVRFPDNTVASFEPEELTEQNENPVPAAKP